MTDNHLAHHPGKTARVLTFRQDVARLAYACRKEGSSSRVVVGSLFALCDKCQALALGKCLTLPDTSIGRRLNEIDQFRAEAKLKPRRRIPLCACGRVARPGLKICVICSEKKAEMYRRYRDEANARLWHKCAARDCSRMTTGKLCRACAALARENMKRLSKRLDKQSPGSTGTKHSLQRTRDQTGRRDPRWNVRRREETGAGVDQADPSSGAERTANPKRSRWDKGEEK